ncbi:MAG: hypothetical protein U0531_16150 [Dehalococcoidia bacterium]
MFLGTMLENTLFLGVLLPGAFILILAGLSAHDGFLDLRLAIVAGVLGTSIARYRTWPDGSVGDGRAAAPSSCRSWAMRGALMRRTGVFVLAYHFLGYTRLLGPVTAGASAHSLPAVVPARPARRFHMGDGLHKWCAGSLARLVSALTRPTRAQGSSTAPSSCSASSDSRSCSAAGTTFIDAGAATRRRRPRRTPVPA